MYSNEHAISASFNSLVEIVAATSSLTRYSDNNVVIFIKMVMKIITFINESLTELIVFQHNEDARMVAVRLKKQPYVDLIDEV